MSFLGMDTSTARQHAERLVAAARDVSGMRETLGSAVEGASWQGMDAEDFRERWRAEAAQQIAATADQLAAAARQLQAQADAQDATSEDTGVASSDPQHRDGHLPGSRSTPPAPGGGQGDGYLHEDNPWLPDWLEGPLEQGFSDLAGTVSDGIGTVFDGGMDLLTVGGRALGLNMDGAEQFRRDADSWGETWRDLVTGERVPTVAELAAGGIVTGASAGVALYEAATGQDTAFMDDRPGGIVAGVTTTPGGDTPQDLQDLILQNNALRLDNPGQQPLENGQIGVQEVRSAQGGEPVYIVQIPPTEGAAFTNSPEAYGGQGNSRDWGSNLRLVMGQHPAAMDDIEAAMQAAGVPPGAHVMLVGHSQGGIVGAHLAADPAFNNTSGAPGTYDITHCFSVGSPVQTVVPAQDSTQLVNVSHHAGIGVNGVSGDMIAGLDLGGLQVDGGTLSAPNRHEVSLPGYPVPSIDPVTILESNHDSVGPGNQNPDLGYAGTVARATGSDPTLSALQQDLSGTYLGPGTEVVSTTVVTVGRGQP